MVSVSLAKLGLTLLLEDMPGQSCWIDAAELQFGAGRLPKRAMTLPAR